MDAVSVRYPQWRRAARLLLGLGVGSVAAAGAADAQVLEVGPNVLALAAPAWGALVEPHIATHRTDPNHLIGAVIVADTAGTASSRWHCALLMSSDGGKGWSSQTSSIGNCADPWLAMTGSGEAVFLALGRHAALGTPGMGLLVARSPDGGRTWSDTLVGLGTAQDRPTMAADPRPDAPRAVVVFSGQSVKLNDDPVRWSVFVARSVNGAQSFRLPVHIVPSTLNLNSAEGAILDDGTILASFVDFQRNVDGFRSRAGMLETRRVWVLRSRDGGRTFSPPMLASEQCGQSSYDVAADLSDGAHAGRVYLACRSRGSGILLHHSDDAGESWSPGMVIPGSEPGAYFRAQPRIAVNPAGMVGIVWLDAGDDSEARCYRVVAVASANGGETFSQPTEVSPRSCPDPQRNGFAYRRWRQGGDYFGWAAAADGRFHALWSDGRRGAFDLWSATVTVRP